MLIQHVKNFFLDENNKTALLLSLISGLSTGLGGLFIAMFGSPSKTVTGLMLGFASGVMIYVSALDLLPEAHEAIGTNYTIMHFILGASLMHFLVKQLPEPDPSMLEGTKFDKKLLMTSLVVVTGISLHNFPEGMAVYLSTLNGWRLGVSIAVAIGLHNFPEGMAVAAPLYAATKSRWIAVKWSLISGLCEPIGALTFGLVFKGFMDEFGVCCMLAGVSAVMLYICVKELIPSSYEFCGFWKMIASNLFGCIVLYFCSLMLAQFEE